MSESLAKIWARRIYAGAHTLDEVFARFGNEGVAAVRSAYFDLYGIELN